VNAQKDFFELFATCAPDLTDEAAAADWTRQQASIVKSIDVAALTADAVVSLTAAEACAENQSETLPASCIRRFALAALVADWACYTDPAAKESYPHLLRVVSTFPAGFRVWLHQYSEDTYIPVGYSGWHPIPEAVYSKLHDTPEQITNRDQIMPIKGLEHDCNYAYIFNISIIQQLQKTTISKSLIKTLVDDLQKQPLAGLAVITVSPDGQRIARRFGLHQTGSITHHGQKEEAFAGESPFLPPQ
jgi:hypothetical protein